MIELANLWALWLLPLPLLMRLLPAYRQYRPHLRSPLFQHLIEQQAVKPTTSAWINRRKPLQTMLLVIMWLSLLLSASRPQWVAEPISIETASRDLMVVLDISGSMASLDASGISRLDNVKALLKTFSESRQGDRLGLIVFADKPYIQAPLSSDLAVWNILLEKTLTGPAGQNTAIGDALGLALNHLQHSELKDKVILLVTDGSDNRSLVPAKEAALIAKQKGVRIFSIAIGSDDMGVTPVDYATLEAVALLSEGKYYRADDSASLINIRNDFEAMVPARPQQTWIYPRQELYYFPLTITLVTIMLAVLVSLYRKRQASRD